MERCESVVPAKWPPRSTRAIASATVMGSDTAKSSAGAVVSGDGGARDLAHSRDEKALSGYFVTRQSEVCRGGKSESIWMLRG